MCGVFTTRKLRFFACFCLALPSLRSRRFHTACRVGRCWQLGKAEHARLVVTAVHHVAFQQYINRPGAAVFRQARGKAKHLWVLA